MLPLNQQSLKCNIHHSSFDLVGNDKFCELNCLICCDCLRTLDHNHKYEGVNHKTIAIKEMQVHFQKLKNFSQVEIERCKEKVEIYVKKFMKKMETEINKQKTRLEIMIQSIVLTQVSKNDEELKVLENLLHGNYQKVICKEIGKITKKLFAFVPQKISPGFQVFEKYIKNEDMKMENRVSEILKSLSYQTLVMKDVLSAVQYPTFGEKQKIQIPQIQSPQTPKRDRNRSLNIDTRRHFKSVNSEDSKIIDSPTKTPINLRSYEIKIKKPLDFKESQIIKTREQKSFIEKLFSCRVYDAKILYRASDNDFSIKRFHQNCDGQKSTITFVKTEFNKIIGGYTPLAWKSTKNTIHTDFKKQSFLFSLTLKQKMALIDEKCAIFNSSNFGPTFGAGADLAICHNSDREKTSYSQFPFSYGNNRYFQSNQHSTFLFTGQQNGNHFLIKEWEVWKLEIGD